MPGTASGTSSAANTVQVSDDGRTWTDIAIGPGRPSLTGEMVIALPPTTARHLRLGDCRGRPARQATGRPGEGAGADRHPGYAGRRGRSVPDDVLRRLQRPPRTALGSPSLRCPRLQQPGGRNSVSNRRKLAKAQHRRHCIRCRQPEVPGQWNVLYKEGLEVGLVCPDCQTDEESLGADVSEALIAGRSGQGRHVHPEPGREERHSRAGRLPRGGGRPEPQGERGDRCLGGRDRGGRAGRPTDLRPCPQRPPAHRRVDRPGHPQRRDVREGLAPHCRSLVLSLPRTTAVITKSRLTIAQRSLGDRGSREGRSREPEARIAAGAPSDSHRRPPGGCPAATRGRSGPGRSRPRLVPTSTSADNGLCSALVEY